ncbi:cytochrome P450 [Dichomitus squalens]|uniref:Cytochrome P450 n=1 Tax=Dichomitus squalens TaxID=114155 RepID=A0A4Q9NEP8_9APHY|nr:cytochrome P450 [Dichomitus squalens]TBU39529.1 cytochrome P450 [Dichomitus squalens]
MLLAVFNTVVLVLATLCVFIYHLLRVPHHLRHIPKVPLWPLLLSYFSGEVEEQRVKRLVLPFAKQMRTEVVLVYCLGDWMVQILEPKAARRMLEDPKVWKKPQSKDMLLWRLIGNENIFMSNGEMAKRHLRITRDALYKTSPINTFISLAETTISLMGDGGRIRWDDYAIRYTLDAFGLAVVGYNFDALKNPHGSFVQQYHDVMTAISNPLYVVLPLLERWVPRVGVKRQIDRFVSDLCQILDEKRANPGDDVITYMFQDPDMTEVEYRDNTIVMFVAGHDTTAGAIASVVYYLAINPEIQHRAREEILEVLGNAEPKNEHFVRTPYLNAVLREAMRCNTPSNTTLPRISDVPIRVGEYIIPPGTSMVLNICAVHFNDSVWDNPSRFDPERFLDEGGNEAAGFSTFSMGPRSCVARLFSLTEQRVLISMLLREFRWTLPEDSAHSAHLKNGFSAFALSIPENLYIDFFRIKPTEK